MLGYCHLIKSTGLNQLWKIYDLRRVIPLEMRIGRGKSLKMHLVPFKNMFFLPMMHGHKWLKHAL